ncbi:neuroplastin isoform X2 [Hetaerina americana]|uniref:neuroplastin isoform X2 n=1 Tax=Hetaerina americana TaxID=62018 RepID=UPI003A7F108E
MENLSCVIVSLLFIGLGSIVKTQGDIAPNYDFGTYKVLEPKQPLVLQCNVTGTEQKYTLKWFKEDKPIVVDEKEKRIQIKDDERKLVIEKPGEDDIANYTCRVNHSSFNASSVDLNATITVVGRPTLRMPSTMNLVEGEKLILNCTVNGKPIPEVVWKFGNISINETSGRYKLMEGNGVPNAILSIDEVIMDDRGLYTCFAQNVANSTETSTYVRVKDKLAALWPFLGICAEVFVLCSIILIYEKKHNKAELEESDTDQSPEQKNTPDHGKDSDVRQRK